MARIAVDMDEVIADFNAKFIATFNTRFQQRLTVDDMAGKSFLSLRPEMQQEIVTMIGEPGFFADLPVMPDSQDVLARLSQQHEIFITTAARACSTLRHTTCILKAFAGSIAGRTWGHCSCDQLSE